MYKTGGNCTKRSQKGGGGGGHEPGVPPPKSATAMNSSTIYSVAVTSKLKQSK